MEDDEFVVSWLTVTLVLLVQLVCFSIVEERSSSSGTF